MTIFFSLISLTMPLKARHSWPISSRVRTATWTSWSPRAKRRTPAVSSRKGPSSERDSQAPITITTSNAKPPTIMRSRSSRRTGAKASDESILAISAHLTPGTWTGPHEASVRMPR